MANFDTKYSIENFICHLSRLFLQSENFVELYKSNAIKFNGRLNCDGGKKNLLPYSIDLAAQFLEYFENCGMEKVNCHFIVLSC